MVGKPNAMRRVLKRQLKFKHAPTKVSLFCYCGLYSFDSARQRYVCPQMRHKSVELSVVTDALLYNPGKRWERVGLSQVDYHDLFDA